MNITPKARARIDAAAIVAAAATGALFRSISAAEARRIGYEIEGPSAMCLDWPEGFAITNPTTGKIEIAIDHDCFALDPTTGSIEDF